MAINTVRVRNYRSLADTGSLELGSVTVLTGRNNSGKSALLRSLLLLQGGPFDEADLRLRGGPLAVEATFDASPHNHARGSFGNENFPADASVVAALAEPNNLQVMLRYNSGQAEMRIGPFPSTRPGHYMVPVFARRKAGRYDDGVNVASAQAVQVSDSNLTSRISILTSGDHAQGAKYRALVAEVLGLNIGTFATRNGQQPGIAFAPFEGVALDRMGEGLSGALSLIVELADATDRLFLIEEPENDLHPQALHALLEALSDAVPANQVLVSTHSDLVLRQLGAIPGAVIYGVALQPDAEIPTSSFRPIATREDRLELLAELGYEPELPTAWLVLEESTAERICRQVLIPMFAPRLAGIRTVAGRGASEVGKLFEDLRRVVLFAHLSERYANKAWVFVDGDDEGLKAVAALRQRYPSWSEDHFATFDAAHFEEYYPARFAEQVAIALAEKDWKRQRDLKGDLAEALCAWATASPDEAKAELAESAADVIRRLKGLEFGLFDPAPESLA